MGEVKAKIEVNNDGSKSIQKIIEKQ